jgi:hypothetical protein
VINNLIRLYKLHIKNDLSTFSCIIAILGAGGRGGDYRKECSVSNTMTGKFHLSKIGQEMEK